MRVRYALVVTAEVGDRGEGAMRLKGLLKVALRRFGMRCLSVGEDRLEAAVSSAPGREAVGREAMLREGGGRTVGWDMSGRGCEAGLFG